MRTSNDNEEEEEEKKVVRRVDECQGEGGAATAVALRSADGAATAHHGDAEGLARPNRTFRSNRPNHRKGDQRNYSRSLDTGNTRGYGSDAHRKWGNSPQHVNAGWKATMQRSARVPKAQPENLPSQEDMWARQQEGLSEVECDETGLSELVFEPGSWQHTLREFWHSTGELSQVVGMGQHRHWSGKINFTADGKFWMIKPSSNTSMKSGNKKKWQQLEHWSAASGQSGRWERHGSKLLLYWFKWPAEKLETQDGGQTFHSTQGYKFSIEYEHTLQEWHPDHMPKDFVPATANPKSRKKFVMPTRQERCFYLLEKYKTMGQNVEAPLPEGIEPTEAVAFLRSALFDMYQILSLELTFRVNKSGARGSAKCSELLSFDEESLKTLQSFKLGEYLERNDEKRVSVLQELVARVWAVVKGPIHDCPIPNMAMLETDLEHNLGRKPPVTSLNNSKLVPATVSGCGGEGGPVSLEVLNRKLAGMWAEFVMLKDVDEAVECTREFAHPDLNSNVVKMLVIDKLLNAKPSQLDDHLALLVQLLCDLRRGSSPVMSAEELKVGLIRTCAAVPDASIDNPSCPVLVAKLCAKLTVENCIEFNDVQEIVASYPA